MPVSGFGVDFLETLCLSADLVLTLWKRCACQRIWCRLPGNAVPVSRFGVGSVETLCVSADLVLTLWNAVPVSPPGTLCLSADVAHTPGKGYVSQLIWR